MCRLAAYLGPEISLASLLYDAPHGLEHQAYRPREMVSGTVNVDGTGVVWWREGEGEPLRYVTERPPWSDPNLPSLSRRLCGRLQLAAVRSATAGMPFGPGAVLPFVRDGMAGVLNGYIAGFRGAVAARMIAGLPESLRGSLEVVTDAAVVFLTAAAQLERGGGGGLQGAARAAVEAGRVAAREGGVEASLTLVLADRDGIVGVRAAEGVPPNSLHYLEDGGRWPGGRLLASEPLDDDPRWAAVPPDTIVALTRDGITLAALG